MKITHHIPTEQYGFTEVETESLDEMSQDDIACILGQYRALAGAVKEAGGLPEPEYQKFLDKYLLGEGGETEVYNQMSDTQKNIIQTIKRALARIKSRELKATNE